MDYRFSSVLYPKQEKISYKDVARTCTRAHTHTQSVEREGRKQTPGEQGQPGVRPGRPIPGDRGHVAGSLQPGGSETLPASPAEVQRCWRLDMGRRGRLGLGCRGTHSTWGAQTKSGTVRGETEAWRVPVRVGVKHLLDSAPTSCFLWGGAERAWRLGVDYRADVGSGDPGGSLRPWKVTRRM